MQRSDLSIKGLWSRYRHVNWALADQAMVSGVNFLTGILFARYLGLEEYGRFTLAWMAVLFCNSFQQAGIIAPMMSFGPKQKVEDEPAYYGAVVVQQLLWSVLCFFLLWGGVRLSGLVKPEWHIQHLGLPLSTALLAWQLQDFLRRYFFVRDQGGLAFFNDAISYLGQLTLLVVLFNWTTLDTARVLWLIAGTSALAVVVSARHLWGGSVSRGSLRKVTGRHWTFSKWLFSAEAMRWLSGNLFVVCSGYYLGAAVVGALKASQNIMGVSHILFQGLENIVPARASRIAHSAGLKSMFRYLGKVFVFGGAAVGMVAV
ncbi:MAG: oligosaccharide flippase family protein, partial [Desulfuromonadaceae bacterium]